MGSDRHWNMENRQKPQLLPSATIDYLHFASKPFYFFFHIRFLSQRCVPLVLFTTIKGHFKRHASYCFIFDTSVHHSTLPPWAWPGPMSYTNIHCQRPRRIHSDILSDWFKYFISLTGGLMFYWVRHCHWSGCTTLCTIIYKWPPINVCPYPERPLNSLCLSLCQRFTHAWIQTQSLVQHAVPHQHTNHPPTFMQHASLLMTSAHSEKFNSIESVQ